MVLQGKRERRAVVTAQTAGGLSRRRLKKAARLKATYGQDSGAWRARGKPGAAGKKGGGGVVKVEKSKKRKRRKTRKIKRRRRKVKKMMMDDDVGSSRVLPPPRL